MVNGRGGGGPYLVKGSRGLASSAPQFVMWRQCRWHRTSNPYDHSVTNVQGKYGHAIVSTLVISHIRCADDDVDFVSSRHSIGARLIKVWMITRSLWDALDTTVYNPRQLGGRGLIEPKYYEGGHCESVLRPHRFFNIHPLCQGDGTAI